MPLTKIKAAATSPQPTNSVGGWTLSEAARICQTLGIELTVLDALPMQAKRPPFATGARFREEEPSKTAPIIYDDSSRARVAEYTQPPPIQIGRAHV